MVFIDVSQVWTRCGKRPIQIHHMLFRSRGGGHLDEAGETYHLVALCLRCHQLVHEDRESGMVIDGYIESLGEGKLSYVGTDEYLREKYGRKTNERSTIVERERQSFLRGAGKTAGLGPHRNEDSPH